MSVEITLLQEGEIFYAPTNIPITAFVTMAGARAGDVARVEFFANSNKLGSVKTAWHGDIYPPNNPHQAQYMHIVAAGFDPVELNWKKAPPGDYALTVRANSSRGIPAVSQPVNIKILPPP